MKRKSLELFKIAILWSEVCRLRWPRLRLAAYNDAQEAAAIVPHKEVPPFAR